MLSPCATQLVGTVTLSASGTGSIVAAQSNTPFKNLSITVKPIDTDSQYTVTVYFYGEVAESHSFPDANQRVICHMLFPNMLFPANVGTDTIPAHYNPNRQDFGGIPVLVRITSREAARRVFEVYSVFEAYDHCRFGVINQET